MKKYFGTDGFRGKVDKDLTTQHAYKIGEFLGNFYRNQEHAKILIGRDTRISGPRLEKALEDGIRSMGIDVYTMGVTTTPSISFIVKEKGFCCGIMISASHNPYEDNGIKIINQNGMKIEDEIEIEIEKYLDGLLLIEPISDPIGKRVEYEEGKKLYIDYLYSIFSENKMTNLKVGLDLSNGSATEIVPELFKRMKMDVCYISNNPDGKNINKNCGSTHIEVLQKLVIENHLDIGFAYDGDADRCLIVGKTGKVIDGDGILFISSLFYKKKNMLSNNMVVSTVMSNMGLNKSLKAQKINHIETSVGDKNVSMEMEKNKALLGGEISGHVIYKNYAMTGDGIITSIIILNIIWEEEKPLEMLLEDYKQMPQENVNIKVTKDVDILNNSKVKETVKILENQLENKGRILLRKSGTEPVIRILVEAEKKDVAKSIITILKETIEGANNPSVDL